MPCTFSFLKPIAKGVEIIFEIDSSILEKISEYIPINKIPPSEPLFLKQVHGGIIHFLDDPEKTNFFRGAVGDGFITTIKNLPISIRTADCIPVFLCDKNSKFAALLHGSWRSIAVGIIENAMAIIARKLNILPNGIYCAMGPGILREDYEVGKKVVDKFPHSTIEKDNGKIFLDLPGEIARRLISLGLHADSIILPPVSTFRESWLPSYRRDGSKSGRIKTIAWLE